jgi:5-methyltetrahydrofolate--homocysteine methyltransferase
MTLGDALAEGVLVADGAFGTLGLARGLPGLPVLWTLARPDAVEAIHREYVEAGARLVVANTFSASRAWLPADVDVAFINREAVALARRAAGGLALVAGDIGPTGFDGSSRSAFDEAVAVFREQASALVDAGVDALLVETMASIDELRAALVAVESVCGETPVIASATFERGARTRTGATPADLASLADEMDVTIVGANCSEGPDSIAPVVAALVRLTNRPILAKPSAGLPDVRGGAVVYPLDADAMARAARRLVDSGARVVGGCCGTTPDTIRAIVRALG